MTTEAVPARLLGAALCSGAAALFYESLWTRALALVLGSTVQASAIVFSAFLVGLALGAMVFGRFRPVKATMVRTYMGLELCIAATAPLVGFLLGHYEDALALVAGGHDAPLRIVRGFLSTLLAVAAPTILMGGTFPVLLSLAHRASAEHLAIARVYAVNTLGAALGAVACGTVTIGLYGISASYGIAAALNVAAAGFAFTLDTAAARTEPATTVPGKAPTNPRTNPLSLVVGAVSSGALVLAVEVVWTRFAGFFLGNRTFATMILLAWVLVLLAAGARVSERLSRVERVSAAMWLAGSFALSAFGLLLSTSAVAWWIDRQTAVEASLPGVRTLVLPYRILETGALLLPSLLPLGVAFPICLVQVRAEEASVGRATGILYGLNTVGAVFGSLTTGGWALAALGSYEWVRWLSVGCVVAAATVHLVGSVRRGRNIAIWAAATLVVLVTGRLALPRELSVVGPGERLIRRVEDEYGVFQVTDTGGGRLRTTNNRTSLIYVFGSPETRFVQQMQAHLGVWFRPRGKQVAVLGSGYGITAGAFGLYDGIAHVDAVEILPALVAAAPLFARENFRYDVNPKITVTVDDARHFLATHAGLYDIISLNMSDPHLPGCSALFHAEFYEIVKRHLAPGGVVLQHAFGSDVDVVLATLAASFPHIRLFRSYENGLNVVASLEPLVVDEASITPLVEREPVRAALGRIGLALPLTPAAFARAGFGKRDFPAYFHPSVPLATDDHPRLEFSARGGPNALLFANE